MSNTNADAWVNDIARDMARVPSLASSEAEARRIIITFLDIMEEYMFPRPASYEAVLRMAEQMKMPIVASSVRVQSPGPAIFLAISWIVKTLRGIASEVKASTAGESKSAAQPGPRRSAKRDEAYAIFQRAITTDGFEQAGPGKVWDALHHAGDPLDWTREAFIRAVNRAARDENGTRHDRQRNARSARRKRDM